MTAIAFLFHAPGLWHFHRFRLGPRTVRRNLVAVGLTLAAIAAGFAWSRSGLVAVATWALGHAAWGAWLAARVRRGTASE